MEGGNFTGDIASRLLEAEKEISQLRASRRELRRQQQDAILVGETLQHEYLELRAKFRRLEEEFTEERRGLLETIESQKMSLAKERETRMEYEAKEATLQTSLSNALAEIHTLDCSRRELETQIRKLREEVLDSKRPTLQLEIDKHSVAEMEEMMGLLKARVASLEEQLASAHDRTVKYDDFEAVVVALRQTVRDLQARLETETSLRGQGDSDLQKAVQRYEVLEKNSSHAITMIQLAGEEQRSIFEGEVDTLTAAYKGCQDIIATYRVAFDSIHETLNNSDMPPEEKVSVIEMHRVRALAKEQVAKVVAFRHSVHAVCREVLHKGCEPFIGQWRAYTRDLGRNVMGVDIVKLFSVCGHPHTREEVELMVRSIGKSLEDTFTLDDFVRIIPSNMRYRLDSQSNWEAAEGDVHKGVLEMQRLSRRVPALEEENNRYRSLVDAQRKEISDLKYSQDHSSKATQQRDMEISELRRQLILMTSEGNRVAAASAAAAAGHSHHGSQRVPIEAMFQKPIVCPECHKDVTIELGEDMVDRFRDVQQEDNNQVHLSPTSAQFLRLPPKAFLGLVRSMQPPGEGPVCTLVVSYLYKNVPMLDTFTAAELMDEVHYAWLPVKEIEQKLKLYDRYDNGDSSHCMCGGMQDVHTILCKPLQERFLKAARFKACVMQRDPNCLTMLKGVQGALRPSYKFLKGTSLALDGPMSLHALADAQSKCEVE
eukprot:PhF_6_TR36140/c1_g1_i1/m.52503